MHGYGRKPLGLTLLYDRQTGIAIDVLATSLTGSREDATRIMVDAEEKQHFSETYVSVHAGLSLTS